MLSGNSKANFSFFLQQPNYELPESYEIRTNDGYWSYGRDNAYPQSLWNMFSQSSQNKAVIMRKQREIIGSGLYSDDPKITDWLTDCNTRGESFHDIFEQLVLDYLIFGGFTTQIVFGAANNKLTDIFYIDIKKCRFNILGNKILHSDYWGLSNDFWGGGLPPKPTKHSIYAGQTTGSGVYYYNSGLSRMKYPVPEYEGCLADIQNSVEISNYFLSQIRNGLFGSFKITVGGAQGMTEDEKDEFTRRLERQFQGSSNAGRYFMDFVNDVNSPNLLIEAIQQPDLDKRFVIIKESVTQSIYEGHGVVDPSLFGVQTPSGLGQQKNPQDSLKEWQRSYVIPTQTKILRAINKLLSVKFPNIDLKIKQLQPVASFADEILISSMMTSDEIREKLLEGGWIINVKADGILRVDDTPTTIVDITDRQLNSPPKPNPTSGNTANNQIITGTTAA